MWMLHMDWPRNAAPVMYAVHINVLGARATSYAPPDNSVTRTLAWIRDIRDACTQPAAAAGAARA
jgi:hypothetical protein